MVNCKVLVRLAAWPRALSCIVQKGLPPTCLVSEREVGKQVIVRSCVVLGKSGGKLCLCFTRFGADVQSWATLGQSRPFLSAGAGGAGPGAVVASSGPHGRIGGAGWTGSMGPGSKAPLVE